MCVIYIYLNTKEWKYYVGQTVRTFDLRHYEHVNESHTYFDYKLKAHLEDFIWTWFEVSESELDSWELFLIEHLNSAYPNGYNLIASTGGVKHHNPETCEKLSVIHTGMKHSDATKSKISRTLTGITRSDVTKAKLSASKRGSNNPMFGKRQSAEVIKRKSKRVGQYSLDGEFIQEFPSAKEAAVSVGAFMQNITAVCRGELKTSKGYIWKYL